MEGHHHDDDDHPRLVVVVIRFDFLMSDSLLDIGRSLTGMTDEDFGDSRFKVRGG